jgi:ATP:ADP antiporter, AAA family
MKVKKEFANPFNAAFEQGDLEHRCALLRNLFPKDLFPGIETIIAEILRDKKLFYNNWSKACSLYVSRKFRHPVDEPLISKYLQSESLLLKETAGYAIQIN